MEDEILRQIREARENLLVRHGSFKQYVKHLQALAPERQLIGRRNTKGQKQIIEQPPKGRSRRSA